MRNAKGGFFAMHDLAFPIVQQEEVYGIGFSYSMNFDIRFLTDGPFKACDARSAIPSSVRLS